MKTASLAVLVAIALHGPVAALETPAAGPRDPNLRTIAYRIDARVLVIGTMRRSTTITFAPEESVIRVIFGDDEIWEGPDPATLGNSPLRNHLPLWPKKPGRTNLQVITSRAGQPDRLYQFATQVRETPASGEDDPEAIYGLTFTYSSSARPTPVLAGATAGAAAPRTPVSPAADRAAREAERTRRTEHEAAARLAIKTVWRSDYEAEGYNWRWVGRGDRSLEPVAVFNDGYFIYLRFAQNTPVPAMFCIAEGGVEQTCPPRARDDMFIVDRYVRVLRLRANGQVIDLINVAYDDADGGLRPESSARRPTVRRELRR